MSYSVKLFALVTEFYIMLILFLIYCIIFERRCVCVCVGGERERDTI